MRASGLANIGATLHRHAAKPLEALGLVMIFVPS
jgi:hypothetical protein